MTEFIDASPCIAVCRLDADDCCEGCRRTRQEIADWLEMSSAARDRVNRRILEEAHPAVRFRLLGDAGGGGKRRGGRKARHTRAKGI